MVVVGKVECRKGADRNLGRRIYVGLAGRLCGPASKGRCAFWAHT